MSKTKKIILLVSMVVVLAVAAYLNIMLLSKKSGENGSGDVQSTSTFSIPAARIEIPPARRK